MEEMIVFHWPQITYLILALFGLIFHVYNSKSVAGTVGAVSGTVIVFYILYMGGFFS
jgi:hypothetical protein